MEYQDLMDKWSRKFQQRIWSSTQHNISTSLNSGVTYSWNLSGLQGIVKDVAIYVRTLGLTSSTNGRTIRDYISSFEFKDAGGSNLLGGNVETSAFNRFNNQARWLPGTLANSHAIHYWSWSEAPVQDQKTGSLSGFFPFEGSESVVITTNSSATGSCQINLDFKTAHLLLFEGNGNVTAAK
jgi:hypothetical protein